MISLVIHQYLDAFDFDLIGENTASEPDVVARDQLSGLLQQDVRPIDFCPVRTAKVFEGICAPLACDLGMAPGDPLAYLAFVTQVNVGYKAERRVRTSNNQFPLTRQVNALARGSSEKIEAGLETRWRVEEPPGSRAVDE